MEREHSISIAIADDHPVFRQGLIDVLSTYGNIQIVVEADDGQELLEKIAALDTFPDICLLDIQMPNLNGYETIVQLKKRWPGINVIVLSLYKHSYAVHRMFWEGASGFLSKNSTAGEIYQALLWVYEKGTYHANIDPADMMKMLSEATLKNNITAREMEFLKYCCADMHIDQIAMLMNVSPNTADGYSRSLFHKLGVHTRAGLVSFAKDIGLVY
jgi:two-component system invasion response regulator UvrY